ncbi:transposase [Micromonospora zamorensis]|uniref:transposase n=1 Tax=Micromonospora zamorensis TaxID=709883 RepID=UPI00379D37F9
MHSYAAAADSQRSALEILHQPDSRSVVLGPKVVVQHTHGTHSTPRGYDSRYPVAHRWQALQAEIDDLETELSAWSPPPPRISSALPGVGVYTAGQLLVTAGDNPNRLRSEAPFARLYRAAAIPVSSGRTNRHRPHRCGDRCPCIAAAKDPQNGAGCRRLPPCGYEDAGCDVSATQSGGAEW